MADVGSDKDTERAVEGEVQQGQEHEEQEPEEGLCTKNMNCHLCRLTSESSQMTECSCLNRVPQAVKV